MNYLVYPYIRLAGYLPDPIRQTDPATTYSSTARALGGTDNDSLDEDVKDGTDTITVRFRGQSTVIGGSTADGSITNCAGVRGNTGVSALEVVKIRFYVTNATDGVSDLQCDVSVTPDGGGTPTLSSMPVLQGVQDLQVLYGTGVADPTTSDRISQHYYTANNVPDWTTITSVRMTITVDNIDKNVAAGSTAVTDRRLRRTFTSTLQIRNRLN